MAVASPAGSRSGEEQAVPHPRQLGTTTSFQLHEQEAAVTPRDDYAPSPTDFGL